MTSQDILCRLLKQEGLIYSRGQISAPCAQNELVFEFAEVGMMSLDESRIQLRACNLSIDGCLSGRNAQDTDLM